MQPYCVENAVTPQLISLRFLATVPQIFRDSFENVPLFTKNRGPPKMRWLDVVKTSRLLMIICRAV